MVCSFCCESVFWQISSRTRPSKGKVVSWLHRLSVWPFNLKYASLNLLRKLTLPGMLYSFDNCFALQAPDFKGSTVGACLVKKAMETQS